MSEHPSREDPARRNDDAAWQPPHEQLLDPVDRSSEVLFGLIMAMTIVGSVSIAHGGAMDARAIIGAALGCNLAWGLVDAVMYLVRTATTRVHMRTLARRLVASDDATARRLLRQELPAELAAITGPAELDAMHRRLLALPPPSGLPLTGKDFLSAAGLFVLVVLATFPVVLPFMWADDPADGMRFSRIAALVMLFLSGWALGRYAGYRRPVMCGNLMVLIGVALILVVIALGG